MNAMKRGSGRALNPLLWIALMVFSAGCAADPVRKVTGRPTGPAPWRIAVLPAQLSPEVKQKAAGKLDKMMMKRTKALNEIRTCVVLHIPGDSYEVIALPVVDRALPPGTVLSPDPETIRAAAGALHADLVLVPEIYSWRRRYYLIHVESRVGIGARIYDGATGALLFQSMHEQVRNQGILKIPAGPFAAAAGPIVGMQHIYMADMCQNMSGEIGEDMRALLETRP